jgi:hypothetical protein
LRRCGSRILVQQQRENSNFVAAKYTSIYKTGVERIYFINSIWVRLSTAFQEFLNCVAIFRLEA